MSMSANIKWIEMSVRPWGSNVVGSKQVRICLAPQVIVRGWRTRAFPLGAASVHHLLAVLYGQRLQQIVLLPSDCKQAHRSGSQGFHYTVNPHGQISHNERTGGFQDSFLGRHQVRPLL